MCTPSTTFLHIFTHRNSIPSCWWLDRLGGGSWEQVTPQNAVKYGETAGITCLTLQPVLALVSMNMTFSSLALCSPSSIMICLQENQAGVSITMLKANLFSTDMMLLTTCSVNKAKCYGWLLTTSDRLTSSLPDLFCCRLAWWWHHFPSLSWHHRSICRSAGMSSHLWRPDSLFYIQSFSC